MFSPNFRVRTSILELPPHLYGAAVTPYVTGHIGLDCRRLNARIAIIVRAFKVHFTRTAGETSFGGSSSSPCPCALDPLAVALSRSLLVFPILLRVNGLQVQPPIALEPWPGAGRTRVMRTTDRASEAASRGDEESNAATAPEDSVSPTPWNAEAGLLALQWRAQILILDLELHRAARLVREAEALKVERLPVARGAGPPRVPHAHAHRDRGLEAVAQRRHLQCARAARTPT